MPSKRKARPAQPAPYSLLDRVGLSLEQEPSKDLVPLAKAAFVGEDSGTQSNALVESKRDESIFSNAGAIQPIYDPLIMALIYENSSNLRQNVDAYVTNIDSFGHHFVPVLDLAADDADERIRDALRAERRYAQKNTTDKAAAAALLDLPPEPTDDEVKARRNLLEIEIRAERADLEMFFDNCTPTMPFSGPEGLRGLTRQDIEVFGYGYWEVIRNGLKEVAHFNKLEARSMRMMPIDKKPAEATILRRVSSLTTVKVTAKKKFRNYVQRFEGSADFVFYKEFGDPRVVSARSGHVFDSTAALKEAEEDAPEATEVIAFKITSVRSVYGAPRWVGAMLAVLGTRQSEEVNFLYFENRSIPPMAIIVSGGRLNKEVVKRLEDHLANNIRGKRNFHRVLIIEGESAGTNTEGTPNNGKMKIELKPLTDSQQQDALFQAYDERNADKVGQMFRLPRLLRGDVRDFNRSCYSEDTETLTEHGWKLQQDIGPEEKIAAFNPASGEMVFVVPAKKLVYDVVDEPMFRFHNKQTDFKVTGDHTVLSRQVGRGGWDVGTAEQLTEQRRVEVPVAPSSWLGTGRTEPFVLEKSCKIERGHTHPQEIDFNDWLEFLGYFISEGGLVLTSHPSAEFLVYIDQKKPEQLSKMLACMDRLGWQYSTQIKPCGTTHILLSNRCLRKWLLENTGADSYDKRIPDEYLNLDTTQLQILFNALMTGDGSVDTRENRTSSNYASMSPILLGQVQRIALQLGMRASVIEPVHAESAVGRVVMSTRSRTTELKMREQERTPSSLECSTYTGKVYCFSVPGYGFFVTRRNGKVAIQGNTAEASVDFAEVQVFGPIRQQFDWLMNTLILPELGIRYHTFRSNAPTVRDPEGLANMIALLANAGVLTPEEGRALARGVFNEDLPRIKEPWVKQPLPITLAGRKTGDDQKGDLLSSGIMSTPGAGPTQEAFTPGSQRNKGVEKDGDMSTGDLSQGGALQPAQGTDDKKRRRTRELMASGLLKIKKLMEQEEREAFVEARKDAEKIAIPRDLFDACFIPDDDKAA